MKPFVQFMTLENLRVFIDPQAIVAFCEFKFRENDIGLVGTRIDFCIGDKITNITVRDPIDYVSDALQVGYDNCPDGLPLHHQAPVLQPYIGPSIEDFLEFLENDPVNLQVRPTPTTYRTPPQETPPCNGNGEAQSTEE